MGQKLSRRSQEAAAVPDGNLDVLSQPHWKELQPSLFHFPILLFAQDNCIYSAIMYLFRKFVQDGIAGLLSAVRGVHTQLSVVLRLIQAMGLGTSSPLIAAFLFVGPMPVTRPLWG